MLKNFLSLFEKKEKAKLVVIFFLNSLTFFFELLSLASLPIFVAILLDASFLNTKLDGTFGQSILQNLSEKDLIILSGSFVVATFVLKNIFLIFLSYFQGLFFKKIKIKLSNKLFNFYLNSPYLYHLQNNPSKLSRNISMQIEDLYVYFFHCLNLFREFLAILVIFSLLIFVNPTVTIISSISLALVSYLYIKTIKPYIKKKSSDNVELIRKITQVIYETFGSVKDIKLLSKEKQIEKFFNDKISKYHSNIFFFSIFERLPRFILEIASIAGIIFISLVYLGYNQNYLSLLPILSLIAISFMRFIPAFNSITTSIYYMKIHEPSVDIVHNELKEIVSNKIEEYKNIKKINVNENKSFFSANGITFYYPDNKVPQLDNISMAIKEGEKVGLTGETGAGKSTLFHIMLGLIYPKSGDIIYKNESIFQNLDEWRKEIGYISQNIYLLDSSVEKNIAFNFLDEQINKEKLRKAINVACLNEKISSMPQGINTLVGNDGLKLSGGERQRIAIARAAYKNPNIFFMDESTSALDDKTENLIMNNLNQEFKNKTFIMIAHRKSTIEKCDKVWKLSNGKLTS
tara:strand:- start:2261 stop:3982 length:1722 start_codon:yes stop_codon:yes gene_type:complete